MAKFGYTLSSEEFDAPTLVYVHQVGPGQEGFFDFYEREVLPGLR